nr:hypothetical protein [Saprospiraceae bacterium]
MDYNPMNTDQLFRGKLRNYEITPPATVWTGIVNRRKAADLRRKALLLLLLLLLLGFVAYMLWPQGEQTPPSQYANVGITEFSADDTQQNTDSKIQTHSMAEGEQLNASQNYSPYSESSPEDTSPGSSSSLMDLSGQNPLDRTSPDSHENSGSQVAHASHRSNTQAMDLSQSQELYLSSEIGQPAPSALDPYSSSSEGLSTISTREMEWEGSTSDADFEASTNLMAQYEQFKRTSLSAVSTLENSQTVELLEVNKKNQVFNYNTCAIRNNPICLESQFPLRYFTIDILAGPDFFDKLLLAKSAEDEEFAELRRNSESALLSYGMSIKLSAVFQNGLALRTGVSFNQINEKMIYKDPNAETRRVVNVLIDTIINAPMDTTFVFDTLSVIETGTRLKEVQNKYQIIDIPFMVGAEFESGNWTLTPSLGVMFNVAFKTRGEVLDQTGEPVNINAEETESSIFRKNLGVSLTGSFGVGYRLSSEYSLMIEPRIRYNLKPLTVEGYPLTQNYFVFGVHAGIRYRFK